jgi:nucleotide-binding universal stress UspA family protein
MFAANKNRKVCLAINDSALSLYAVEWASTNFLYKTDKITLLSVYPDPETNPMAYLDVLDGTTSFNKDETLMDESLNDELARMETVTLSRNAAITVQSHGFPNVATVVLQGNDIGEKLVRRLKKLTPDVVVVGHHRKILHSSIAEHLIHELHLPIVVVKLAN